MNNTYLYSHSRSLLYKMPYPLLFICICSTPPSLATHLFWTFSQSPHPPLPFPLFSLHLDLLLIPLSVPSHHTLTPCTEFICSLLSFLFYPLTVFQRSSFSLRLPPPSSSCGGAVGRGGGKDGKGWRCNNP